MKQQTLAMAADQESGYGQHFNPMRHDEFMKTMDAIVPSTALCAFIEPFYPKAGNGRPPVSSERMLRIHLTRQTLKGKQWYFRMKLYIGVDSQSGQAHGAVVTSANVHDKHPPPDLLHGNEHFTNRRAKSQGVVGEAVRLKSRHKSRLRSRAEHVFGVVKRLCGFGEMRYLGLHINAIRTFTAWALTNIYLSRSMPMAQVRP